MPRTAAAASNHEQTRKPAKRDFNSSRNRVTLQIPNALDERIHQRLAAVRQVDPSIDYSTLLRHLIRVGLEQGAA